MGSILKGLTYVQTAGHHGLLVNTAYCEDVYCSTIMANDEVCGGDCNRSNCDECVYDTLESFFER